eukprot:2201426-Rhodomonas_salina.1
MLKKKAQGYSQAEDKEIINKVIERVHLDTLQMAKEKNKKEGATRRAQIRWWKSEKRAATMQAFAMS